jgi:hypothetical protein
LIISKEDRSIPECQFYLGDGLSGTFSDCPYRFAGSGSHIIEESPKQFPLFGIGNFLKIVFTKQPDRVGKNLAGQVALGLLKVYGQPMSYYKGIVNNEAPILKGQVSDEVDRVLLEMGVPLSQPGQDWTFDEIEKTDALTYAPVDEESRTTLKDMQKLWIQAHKTQDFEKLTALGRDIKVLLNIGNEMLRLKREL